jgi:hypothetical protein
MTRFRVEVYVYGPDEDGLIEASLVDVDAQDEKLAQLSAIEEVRALYPDDCTLAAKTIV